MAPAHSTTRYLCNACTIGVMTPHVTPAGEAIYECRSCNHCGQAAIVEADNDPVPPAYGARINMLMEATGCAAPLAALAIREVA